VAERLYQSILQSRSVTGGGCCHTAATLLVDHGQRRPHDGGMKGRRVATAWAASSRTIRRVNRCPQWRVQAITPRDLKLHSINYRLHRWYTTVVYTAFCSPSVLVTVTAKCCKRSRSFIVHCDQQLVTIALRWHYSLHWCDEHAQNTLAGVCDKAATRRENYVLYRLTFGEKRLTKCSTVIMTDGQRDAITVVYSIHRACMQCHTVKILQSPAYNQAYVHGLSIRRRI